jgi:hypothetical protein
MDATVAGIATDLSEVHDMKALPAILVVPSGIVTAPFTSGENKQPASTQAGKSAAAANATSQRKKVANAVAIRRGVGAMKFLLLEIDCMHTGRVNALVV